MNLVGRLLARAPKEKGVGSLVSSLLASDVFRALATILLPASIVFAPFLFLWPGLVDRLQEIRQSNAEELAFAGLLTLVFVGLVVEDFASRVETHILDPLRQIRSAQHLAEWAEYLCSEVSDVVTANGYIKGIVLRFKFEMNTGVALVLAAISTALLSYYVDRFNLTTHAVVCLLLTVASYLFWEAYASHKLLSETRGNLLKALRAKAR